MMYFGPVLHGSPRLIEVEEPYVVRICGPINVDVKIADIRGEVVGWGSDVLVGLGSIPDGVSG